jgi:putative chitinase
MTPADLTTMMPFAASRAATYAPLLTAAMTEFEIDTPRRQAAFLAQVAYESESLGHVREITDGSAYEGRKDLGNTSSGDGLKFKGRGLLQVTGKANYRACGVALGLDLLASPELLEQPVHASRSAGWFWTSRQLNQLADSDRFGALTRAIDGGYTGLDDRIRFWLAARKFFGL